MDETQRCLRQSRFQVSRIPVEREQGVASASAFSSLRSNWWLSAILTFRRAFGTALPAPARRARKVATLDVYDRLKMFVLV